MTESQLQCACGALTIALTGGAINSVECCCTTCRDASTRFEALPGAQPIQTAHGSTPYVMYRKDRVRFLDGTDQLAEHRLTPDSGSRRVLATCCNTPVFLEFKGGHWLSLYGTLWSEDERPALRERTLTRSLPDRSLLADDVPNPKRHTLGFYGRLFGAWAAMGFRAPAVDVKRTIEI